MYHIHYKNFRDITLLARNLRKNQTSSEEFLWKILRRNNLSGYKFLRQHPVYYRIDKEWVEFFIADFYCAKLQLIIEVDGPIHLNSAEYDSERDNKIFSKGIQVVRIKNEELDDTGSLMIKLNEVINTQKTYISNNKPITSPSLNLKGRGRG